MLLRGTMALRHLSVLYSRIQPLTGMFSRTSAYTALAAVCSTPLHTAAEKNQVGAICALLAAGAPLHARNIDSSAFAPLHTAAWAGSLGAMSALLDAGARFRGSC